MILTKTGRRYQPRRSDTHRSMSARVKTSPASNWSNDQLPEPRTRQEAARGDQLERPGPDPLGDATSKDGPATRRPSGELRPDHGGERVDVAARYPADYVPSDIPAPNIDRPHQAAETWIDGINPERESLAGKTTAANARELSTAHGEENQGWPRRLPTAMLAGSPSAV